MSAPIFDLLKRPDELFVVEQAHLQPRFVEDSVRHALATRSTRFRSSRTTTSCSRSRSTSRRSMSTTSSPSGWGPSASSGASSRPGSRAEQTTLADWLNRLGRQLARAGGAPRSGARCRRRAGGCSGDAATMTAAAPATRRHDRPRVAEEHDGDGEADRGDDRRERRVARQRGRREPDDEAADRRERRERERHATGGRDHLPALVEPRKSGRAWPSIAAAAASTPTELAADREPERARRRTPSRCRAARPGRRASARRRGRRSTRRCCRCPSRGCPRRGTSRGTQ